MTKTTDLSFISNNVKGIQNSLKDLKLLVILKKTYLIMVSFLQKTNTSSKDEIKWKYIIKNDENGRFLLLEAMIDIHVFVLINLYNPNTEKEQVSKWKKESNATNI